MLPLPLLLPTKYSTSSSSARPASFCRFLAEAIPFSCVNSGNGRRESRCLQVSSRKNRDVGCVEVVRGEEGVKQSVPIILRSASRFWFWTSEPTLGVVDEIVAVLKWKLRHHWLMHDQSRVLGELPHYQSVARAKEQGLLTYARKSSVQGTRYRVVHIRLPFQQLEQPKRGYIFVKTWSSRKYILYLGPLLGRIMYEKNALYKNDCNSVALKLGKLCPFKQVQHTVQTVTPVQHSFIKFHKYHHNKQILHIKFVIYNLLV